MKDTLITCYLLIGGNIGDRERYLHSAIQKIENNVGSVLVQSNIYESEAWGFEHEQDFLNQVLKVSTLLDAHELLTVLQGIEQDLGRKQKTVGVGYQARTIDLDILYYNHEVIATSDLDIPHKQIQNRMFTLVPLKEIASDYTHDTLKKSNAELTTLCEDVGRVTIYKAKN